GDSLTVVAPGEDIYSTFIDSSYKNSKGTSMATPIVSGIISLIWSYNKSLKSGDVIKILKKYAVQQIDGKDLNERYGYGVVPALFDHASYYAARLSIDENEECTDS